MARTFAQSVGERTEQLALDYLQRAGLSLMTRNFRCRVGEIDLVMLDNHCLVFVEVRSRRHSSFPGMRYPSAIESIGPQKQRKLSKAALFFIAKHKVFSNHTIRFDVVAYDGPTPERYELQWIRDAFRPGG